MLYWLISVVFGAGALLVPPVWSIVNFRHQNVSTRRWVRPPPFVDMDFPGRTVTAANFPAWLDHAYPLPPSRRFFSIWWRGDDWSIRYLAIPSGAIVLLLLAVVTWPWIICLVLMLLFQTRRRANVRRVHVMRCALYSADFAAWLGPACAALAGWGLWRNRPSRSWGEWTGNQVFVALAWVALALALYACVRLGVGLRRYLNYPHAAAVVAASQVIAVLAVTITLSLLSPLLAFLLRLFWYP